MHNLTVIDLEEEPGIQALNDRPYAGGWVYVGNTGSTTEEFDLHFDTEDGAFGKPFLQQSEVVVHFDETGFDISGAIADSNLYGLTRLDSTLFLVTSANARIEHISVPPDTLIPAFVGFGFLTQQVADTMRYRYHLGQYRSAANDTLIAGQHFHLDRGSRSLFSANAGSDETVLSGDTVTLSAQDIGEDALYFWLNEAGEQVGAGEELDVSPTSNTTYTLEVIAEDDGYKDYDDVTVTVTNGLITSVAPTPQAPLPRCIMRPRV